MTIHLEDHPFSSAATQHLSFLNLSTSFGLGNLLKKIATFLSFPHLCLKWELQAYVTSPGQQLADRQGQNIVK
jgi:hypothetical protein